MDSLLYIGSIYYTTSCVLHVRLYWGVAVPSWYLAKSNTWFEEPITWVTFFCRRHCIAPFLHLTLSSLQDYPEWSASESASRGDRSERRLALDVDREIDSETFTAATDKGRGYMRIQLMHRTRCPENDCDRYGERGDGAHIGRDEEGRVREGCICAYGSREDTLPIGCLHRYQNSIGIRIENGLPSYRRLMSSCEWRIVSTSSSSVDRSIPYWTVD